MPTEITRADIISMDEYAKIRNDRRRSMIEIKRNRRIAVGPDATFYFENYDTMWHQIHEMLYIEQGGEDQISDELVAYNALVPNGRELIATLMFEIDEPERREKFLTGLGGVEETVIISLGDKAIRAEPEIDVDRTSADGKASSVQFLHFAFTQEDISMFSDIALPVVLAIEHEKYPHMSLISEATRSALKGDFT